MQTLAAPRCKTPRAQSLMALIALLFSAGVHAQQVYRIVGPDGKVTFSDRPPITESDKTLPVRAGSGTARDAAELPAELKRSVANYPVTLYTTTDCAACQTGRDWLRQRGIPYRERTVTTSADAAAFQAINPDNSLPVLMIGTRVLKGFLDVEWQQYLDAAGYPASSMLPKSYRYPAPSALAEATATPKTAKPQEEVPSPQPAVPVTPQRLSPTNPAGLQF